MQQVPLSTNIFARNGLYHVVWRSTEKLSDDGELIYVCLISASGR